MKLETLKDQFQGRKFGELILHHLKSQSHSEIVKALQGTFNLLPDFFLKSDMEKLMDDLNSNVFEKSFWQTDCADQFSYIIEIAKDRFSRNGLTPSEDDLFNVFNIIVLNLTYGASSQSEMKKFIRNSVSTSIFQKIFGKKDIEPNYRWSIIFKKGGISQYELKGDNVGKMLGYYMLSFGEKGNPNSPWELFLHFNKTGKELQLTKLYFPNSDVITEELYERIEIIDPGYQVRNFKEEIFINKLTGESIRMETMDDILNNARANMESLRNGTYLERREKKKNEMTFFNVLHEIFK